MNGAQTRGEKATTSVPDAAGVRLTNIMAIFPGVDRHVRWQRQRTGKDLASLVGLATSIAIIGIWNARPRLRYCRRPPARPSRLLSVRVRAFAVALCARRTFAVALCARRAFAVAFTPVAKVAPAPGVLLSSVRALRMPRTRRDHGANR